MSLKVQSRKTVVRTRKIYSIEKRSISESWHGIDLKLQIFSKLASDLMNDGNLGTNQERDHIT